MPRSGVSVRGIRDLTQARSAGRSWSGLAEAPGPQQGPLSTHTPAAPPGTSASVHHFAVHLWPLYDTTAPPLYAVCEFHGAAVHVPPPVDEVDVVGGVVVGGVVVGVVLVVG